ncbi:MAG: NAD-dependent epimerase/dehydratase family protein [Acidobacteriaceae bacterium]|nr:NAD-dependent epimerase/dehydratase family protein [Acidobacteriaceae bacterium]
MRFLISGVCGFVGSRLALALTERAPNTEIVGVDNLLRPGSELNRHELASRGVRFMHGDVRMRSDVESLPVCDFVIDAAANPSVLAGVDGRSSARQLCEHNLMGTLNVLEYCRNEKAGLVLLSSSRVYSVQHLATLPMCVADEAFHLRPDPGCLTNGVSQEGVAECFPVQQPISLYGATKLSSEIMAIEYGAAFSFPVWINRCGVLTGAGQFGTAEQGIFSYWLHAHAARLPLRYIGFGGYGYQVRDAFHPDDLADLILAQIRRDPAGNAVYNIGGGPSNTMSLAQLTRWCNERFGVHAPSRDVSPRPFDIPWIVMDNQRAGNDFQWRPTRSLLSILEEIANHVEAHPDWLHRTGAYGR